MRSLTLTETEKSDLAWYNTQSSILSIWPDGVEGNYYNAPPVGTNTGWQLTSVGDFNGDGKSDLVWYNTISGAVAVWPAGSATGAYALYPIPPSTNWSITAIGDFDGDGKSDLLLV